MSSVYLYCPFSFSNICPSFCYLSQCINNRVYVISHLTFHEQYSEIWDLDEKDPFMRPEGGESVNDVVSRLAIAMATMEYEFQG